MHIILLETSWTSTVSTWTKLLFLKTNIFQRKKKCFCFFRLFKKVQLGDYFATNLSCKYYQNQANDQMCVSHDRWTIASINWISDNASVITWFSMQRLITYRIAIKILILLLFALLLLSLSLCHILAENFGILSFFFSFFYFKLSLDSDLWNDFALDR